ncbi:MAG TPA: glycosyltransferase family 1 protein [Cyanobacteria bacterium UBA11149]|nr:glycosyltransferase family 1 protein [Cyanobacteria bacterium UBA11367]HBE56176.1 glycosyltransferase family 1 protein [Cyanobacteria bacterium UBA11366]HBK62197.1 glycosyltransferase family 1 protein [Cyanobacteria bacterium UBA11166]HBR73894.1 glycosyltransferase family 1 protein [Cyanobacteria bacterium UBA11159]HBS70221.1 glycosyltransferase family 1 protein [Cyanobacteria bacterium UBA11153]HBW90854.1 glycosyltransferase family 1 protein [Cyanobacteria bacterium UBA11149]HCA96348.1 gl
MHIGFLNPQGNFDPYDRYITEHPDFGGQLVYVKQLAIALAAQGHQVDILTRQIIDPEWPEFGEPFDAYPGVKNVRIIRLPAGPKEFLRKELLWPHLVRDWVPNILKFYQDEGAFPDMMTAHYSDGGLAAVLIEEKIGLPFTFTAHSLGAQKMDKLKVNPDNIAQFNEYYYFARRIVVERLSMNRAAINITNTRLERFQQYSHRAYRDAVDVDNDTRWAVIPPGVDPALFSANVCAYNEESIYQLVTARLARDITESRRDFPVILASSRLDPKKNLLGLVQAFAYSEALQEGSNLVLITAGLENPLHEKAKDKQTEETVLVPIREVIENHNLWGKISAFCVPDHPALAATYRFLAKRRSVFALTSLFEPFGLAPLEAAAAGLPVVVTDNSGIRENLQEGGNEYGVLVNPDEPADIARGLERLIGNTDEWERLARDTQDWVLSNYTWESTATGYLTAIAQILSAQKSMSPRELLPIHPFFHNPQPDCDVALEELSHLYFGN